MNKKLLIIFGILFVSITLFVCFGNPSGVDNFIYNAVRSLESSLFDTYFKFITKFGNVSGIIIVVAGILIVLRNKDGFMLCVMTGISALSNTIIKHIIRRKRPSVLRLIKQGGYSFPSGHAMISIAVYGFLIYVVSKYIKNKVLKYFLICLLSFIIVSIGVSRIYVGVHYGTDILAGYCLSLLELGIILNYIKHSKGD